MTDVVDEPPRCGAAPAEFEELFPLPLANPLTPKLNASIPTPAAIKCFIRHDLTDETILTAFGCGLLSRFSAEPRSALALLADFFEQLDLDLLDLEEPVVLFAQEVIDFFVKVADLELSFQVDLVIVLRP